MQKSLMAVAGLAVSGILVVACTMKAPKEVSDASARAGAFAKSGTLAAVPPSLPEPAQPVLPVANRDRAGAASKAAVAMKDRVTPAPQGHVKEKAPVTVAGGREVQADKKPSRLAMLASAAGSLPLISLLCGEDGRISPINMMMKIRSMMPMCAGGNCITTSSGFQRVNAKEPPKPQTVVAAG